MLKFGLDRPPAVFRVLFAMSCSGPPLPPSDVVQRNWSVEPALARDEHSYGNPHQIRVRHLDLDLQVDFDNRQLRGAVTLTVERVDPSADIVVLDTRGMVIRQVEHVEADDTVGARYNISDDHPIMGAPLTIELPPDATRVRIRYETRPEASGLQWLTPEQTAGRAHPFMFTQSQAIHARSWIPLQDSPGVRVTYSARVRTPSALRAVMSATNDPSAPTNGDYVFEMVQPIPSYLIALSVGDIVFQPLGTRAGVYAEPLVVRAAASEFEDTEAMLQAAERLYGPYRWERYDLLVLPPSFPFGGMENPRLTFTTPTILAGDKSLVSLVAHELAHSWSGNLVTNATWRDFWLNEGFTTYIERRIIEEVYGRARAEMEALLGRQVLDNDLERLDDRDQILHVDLTGRDPDDGMTQVPYEKGALFLRHLEETFGRERFDVFVSGYFETFGFRSITTADFVSYLTEHLLTRDDLSGDVDVDRWIHAPGLPTSAPHAQSEALGHVARLVDDWATGVIPVARLGAEEWTTQEWLHFLNSLQGSLSQKQLSELDAAFSLTETANSEIAHAWLLHAIRNQYSVADQRVEEYLTRIGRRKLIQPLFEALAETPAGRQRALEIYRRARPGYHPIAAETIDHLLGWSG